MGCWISIEESTVGILEDWGKFQEILRPGLHILNPLSNSVGIMSMRVRQLDVKVETKTKDNVFVHLTVSVQYLVIPHDIVDAYYRLSDTDSQISSYVFDVVRSSVPNITLDDVFSKKDEISINKQNIKELAMCSFLSHFFFT